jgi:hypothetical protein
MQSVNAKDPLLVVINPEGVLYPLPEPTNVRFGGFIIDGASCSIRRGAYVLIEENRDRFIFAASLAAWS